MSVCPKCKKEFLGKKNFARSNAGDIQEKLSV